jgi:predicted dehydrogenase
MTPIGVGIIGASPDHGWAAATHIPAHAALPEHHLRAVITSNAPPTLTQVRGGISSVHGTTETPSFDDAVEPHRLLP